MTIYYIECYTIFTTKYIDNMINIKT